MPATATASVRAAPAAATPADDAPSQHPLAPLFEASTIRARCTAVMRSVEADLSPSFTLDRSRLPELADRVAALTRERFPDLRVPPHSRWRHFAAGGVDRLAELDARLADTPVAERARVHIDLAFVSVLLDAGAGPGWGYTERTAIEASAMPEASADDLLAALDRVSRGAGSAAPAPAAPVADDGRRYTRSEGLAVASFRAFMGGAFAASRSEPLRADGSALRHLDAAALRSLFQSGPSNPLVGVEGRAALLARLGQNLQTLPGGRPGHLFDRLAQREDGSLREQVHATDVLLEVLRLLAPAWPAGTRVLGLPAGDVWPHRWAGAATSLDGTTPPDRTTEGFVPFHKLSQWLAYSLLEPLRRAGLEVVGEERLTGLPEYRNGGLFIDGGVIVPRHGGVLARSYKPGDETIVEWRALTVCLLDELAVQVRARLGLTEQQFPLACVLEGGTWAAGRLLAAERRPGGTPPIAVESDGTVF